MMGGSSLNDPRPRRTLQLEYLLGREQQIIQLSAFRQFNGGLQDGTNSWCGIQDCCAAIPYART